MTVSSAPATGGRPPTSRLLAGRVGGIAGSLVGSQVLVGLTYIVAARSLTPAALGVVVTCFAIATVSETVFDLGLTNHLLREVASSRLTLADARGLVRIKRRLLVVLALPVMVVCLALAPSLATGVALGVIAPLVWEAATANSLLRSQELFSRAATGQIVGRATGLGLTVAIVLLGQVELALPVGLAASFGVEALLDRVFLRIRVGPPATVAEFARVQWASVSLGFAALAGVGQQLDTPLVTLGGGAGAAGVYAGAGRLLGPLLFLSAALAMVGLPWLARAGDDQVALRTEERRIGRLTACIAFAPLAVAGLGPLVIPFILGHDYEASGYAFAVLAVGASFSTVNQGMAIVLQNRGHDVVVARAIAIGLVLGLVATYVLAIEAGPVAAAAGFTVSQLYIVTHLIARLRRVRRETTPTPV